MSDGLMIELVPIEPSRVEALLREGATSEAQGEAAVAAFRRFIELFKRHRGDLAIPSDASDGDIERHAMAMIGALCRLLPAAAQAGNTEMMARLSWFSSACAEAADELEAISAIGRPTLH